MRGDKSARSSETLSSILWHGDPGVHAGEEVPLAVLPIARADDFDLNMSGVKVDVSAIFGVFSKAL